MREKIIKRYIVIVGILLAVLISLRIYHINKAVELPPTVVYNEGEFVSLGDDYFYQEREKSPGYEIKVLSAEMKNYADFVAEYGQTEDYMDEWVRAEYVIDLEVTIRNNNTDEETGRGIDLINIRVQTVNDSIQVNDMLFSLVNKDLGGELGFRVRPGTEYTIHLPFMRAGYVDKYESRETFLEKEYYLLLSMYPTRKIVILNPIKS